VEKLSSIEEVHLDFSNFSPTAKGHLAATEQLCGLIDAILEKGVVRFTVCLLGWIPMSKPEELASAIWSQDTRSAPQIVLDGLSLITPCNSIRGITGALWNRHPYL